VEDTSYACMLRIDMQNAHCTFTPAGRFIRKYY
jgi:hypothetical protein